MYLHEKLTAHFTLREMIHSAHVTDSQNMPSDKEIENLKKLCTKVLEPLRLQMKCPIHINSGYRCSWLNMMVGGSPTSQHLYGRAADIRCTDKKYAEKILNKLSLNSYVDMAMIEYNPKTKCYWVHVQISASKPRQFIVRAIYVKSKKEG